MVGNRAQRLATTIPGWNFPLRTREQDDALCPSARTSRYESRGQHHLSGLSFVRHSKICSPMTEMGHGTKSLRDSPLKREA